MCNLVLKNIAWWVVINNNNINIYETSLLMLFRKFLATLFFIFTLSMRIWNESKIVSIPWHFICANPQISWCTSFSHVACCLILNLCNIKIIVVVIYSTSNTKLGTRAVHKLLRQRKFKGTWERYKLDFRWLDTTISLYM